MVLTGNGSNPTYTVTPVGEHLHDKTEVVDGVEQEPMLSLGRWERGIGSGSKMSHRRSLQQAHGDRQHALARFDNDVGG